MYEQKIDGWRIVAYKTGCHVRLVSRNGVDHTARFRNLAAAIAALADTTLILDGEVAVFDERLVSRFDLLSEPDPSVLATPPVYVAFDLLYARGQDLRARPLAARREMLERIVDGGAPVFVVPRLSANGQEAWAHVKRRGLEGMVAAFTFRTPFPPRSRTGNLTMLRDSMRSFAIGPVNSTFDRLAGPHSLAAAGQRGRYADQVTV